MEDYVIYQSQLSAWTTQRPHELGRRKKRTLGLGRRHLSKGICALILREWWKKRIFISCQVQESDQKIFVKPEKVGVTGCTPLTQWRSRHLRVRYVRESGAWEVLSSPAQSRKPSKIISHPEKSSGEAETAEQGQPAVGIEDTEHGQMNAQPNERSTPGFTPLPGMRRAGLDPGERRSAVTARASGKWHQFDKGPLLLSLPGQAWCEPRWEGGRREGQSSSGGENGKTLNWQSTWIYQD